MSTPPLDIWVGLESTINRIEDRFVSQSQKNNHVNRLSDLQKFADLDVKYIRYPALWESVSPDDEKQHDWKWLDERLLEIRRLGMIPIVGLIHHGSGPKYTNLIDPDFPTKFANYAKAFAERFPWVENYTPINEILTTSFFSCLYGHWYPHKKNDKDAMFAVYNQVKATSLAMQAIRNVNPAAKLIQTEDIGRAQGTSVLSYQVEFQNKRRWLSYDFLCGKIDPDHPLKNYLLRTGISEQQLEWMRVHSCPPDVLGVNHYLLSDRYLDHRLDRYPVWSHGGNGMHQYADVGAIDTEDVLIPTPASIIQEVWDRYQIPIAVTEAHICGPRESQLRWLSQIWNEALHLKKSGVNIRAVTVWSLLGTFDWNKLCTVDAGFYESGVFDIRTPDGEPKETILAKMIRKLSSGERFDHPVLDQVGWWQNYSHINTRPLVITGRGTLANAFARICRDRKIQFLQLDRVAMDITDSDSVTRVLSSIQPWAVINAAGYVKVDQAEREKDICFRENVVGPSNLSSWCRDNNRPFVTFSSDLVFNGKTKVPYREHDLVDPINFYGQSKAESEKKVLENHSRSLVVRTSSFFGPWDEHNFLTKTLKQIISNQKVVIPSDVTVSPTFVPDLVNATLDLLIDGESGLVHLTNQGSVSWADFARLSAHIARSKNMDVRPELIEATTSDRIHLTAERPHNSALVSERFQILPSLENAIERYFSDLEVQLH